MGEDAATSGPGGDDAAPAGPGAGGSAPGAADDGAPVPAGRYRHHKGPEYEVLCEARHSETEERLVVYRALYGEHGVWVRPRSMWLETVVVDGRSVPRFARIEDAVV